MHLVHHSKSQYHLQILLLDSASSLTYSSRLLFHQVPESQVVMVQFRIFDLEADPTCRYDYVDVYNGHSYTVQKLGRFCGTFRPGALISTSNTMMLEMASDDSTGGRGFLAYFSGGKPHVDGGMTFYSFFICLFCFFKYFHVTKWLKEHIFCP